MFFNDGKLEKKAKELSDMGEKIIALQQDLKTNRDIISIMFDHVPALIFFKDKENRIININQYGVELHGVPKEKILGYAWKESLSEEEAERYYQNDLEVMRQGKPKKCIIEPLYNDPNRIFLTHKLPVTRNGEIIGVLGFSTEITKPLAEMGNE